ncbi:thiamine phosphate synthase [Erythrobacter sp. WH158]|uniref:Thiamine phosphate synthase n=2 Tax=Erythrobacter crassostreae TaxID=2828328 RepID=A0A9X1JKA2_9SPHN|nr:thiamine phosphate synthase [Erythrobacter crassostrea]MBV7258805.1 thiamine phosphate synthase [Erythrobacter crassostrea]
MVARYKALVPQDQSLPAIWLISDARNDAVLEAALRRLPRGSGFIYRHYHLAERDRFARYVALRRIARACGHTVVLADSALTATEWRADGIYGAPRTLYPRRRGLLHLATAHSMREIALSNQFGSDAVLISPIFRTNSHHGGKVLGAARFRLLAKHSKAPVIALGGMDSQRALALDWPHWAAIDGLS